MCPAGYAIGLHIRFTSPAYLFQTYAQEWNDYYSAQGLVMRDPAVAWGLLNTGVVRWSELTDNDPAGVFAAAAKHGLVYGAQSAVLEAESRSMAGFARSDREFTDDELDALNASVRALHLATVEGDALSDEELSTLERRSATR